MTLYDIRYAHEQNASPGLLDFDASDDHEVVQQLRDFVQSGYRNGTWARVQLSDGRFYEAHNEYGRAIGGYTNVWGDPV